jgi:hypothetical protein
MPAAPGTGETRETHVLRRNAGDLITWFAAGIGRGDAFVARRLSRNKFGRRRRRASVRPRRWRVIMLRRVASFLAVAIPV